MERKKPLRRTGFKRKAPVELKANRKPLKRKPMKRNATPRNGRVGQDVRELVMNRAGGRCEAGLPNVCTGQAQEFHHRRSRAVGKDPHTVGNGAALCSACHHYITHVSPRVGIERGLIVSRHFDGDPAEKRMLVQSRGLRSWTWVLLTPEGGYRPWRPTDPR